MRQRGAHWHFMAVRVHATSAAVPATVVVRCVVVRCVIVAVVIRCVVVAVVVRCVVVAVVVRCVVVRCVVVRCVVVAVAGSGSTVLHERGRRAVVVEEAESRARGVVTGLAAAGRRH
jgi:hypothetical protein